jgi:hypothetical protein
MVTARFRAVVELLLACVAAVGCAASWSAVRTTVAVAPALKDEPATASVVYDPTMLLTMLLLAAVAGMLAVVGGARLCRARGGTAP